MDVQQGTSGPDITGLKIDESSRNDRRGGRRLRTGLAIGLVILVAAAAVLALRGKTPMVEVTAARPAGEAGGATLLNASGYVTPRRRATIAAKITARVLDVLVDEGMKVAEGQVLARLDDSDAQRRLLATRTSRDATAALIANLEVNLANAERELKRQQELEQAGYSAVQTRELAQTTVDSLRAQIQAAREQVKAADAEIGVARQDVDNCTVRAPFAGVVVSRDAQVGEMVSPISAGGGFTRTGIATIVDMASLEIEVDVNESYIARVQPDQKVDAVLDAYPDWRIPSKVRTVIPTADRQEGHGESPHFFRQARTPDPPGHGSQSRLPGGGGARRSADGGPPGPDSPGGRAGRGREKGRVFCPGGPAGAPGRDPRGKPGDGCRSHGRRQRGRHHPGEGARGPA
jgi:RND family efflux transporter MFP subunit